MTREEAIRWLEDIHRRFNPTGENLENEGGDVHLQALDMAIEALSADVVHIETYRELYEKYVELKHASAEPIQTRNCDGCDIFTMAEELAKASIEACADEIVRQVKDSRVECDDCKHHHTSEMYEYCDVIAVKGRRQRTVEYCSLGERKGGDSE